MTNITSPILKNRRFHIKKLQDNLYILFNDKHGLADDFVYSTTVLISNSLLSYTFLGSYVLITVTNPSFFIHLILLRFHIKKFHRLFFLKTSLFILLEFPYLQFSLKITLRLLYLFKDLHY